MSSFHPPTGPGQAIDALRLTEKKSLSLLAEMSAGQPTARHNRRRRPRLPWDARRQAMLQIKSPGGGMMNYLVKPRNLSRSGVAVLHGGFAYPDSPCVLMLADLAGQKHALTGRVIRCQHVRAHVHELGICFETPIQLGLFLAAPGETGRAHDGEDGWRAAMAEQVARLAKLMETDAAVEQIRAECLAMVKLIEGTGEAPRATPVTR